MPTIKEYQQKITSLGNTRKITGSMKMISSIKLQKMTKLRETAKPLIDASAVLPAVLMNLSEQRESLFVSGRKTRKRLHMLLVTGDRGMCGRYNKNTIRAMMHHLSSDEMKNDEVTFSVAGIKGYGYLNRHGKNIDAFYKEAVSAPSWEVVKKIGKRFIELFSSGNADEIWVTFSRKVGAFSEAPEVKRLLPVDLTAVGEDNHIDYLVEGPVARSIERTVQLYLQSAVYTILIQSAIAEHSARMSAMDNANNNCDRLLGQYTQLRNRARQAVITTELNEIVTGKEALES
jgi:F-type H+-transporting ATPase subunit gamma